MTTLRSLAALCILGLLLANAARAGDTVDETNPQDPAYEIEIAGFDNGGC